LPGGKGFSAAIEVLTLLSGAAVKTELIPESAKPKEE
jgi:hypothetical protein